MNLPTESLQAIQFERVTCVIVGVDMSFTVAASVPMGPFRFGLPGKSEGWPPAFQIRVWVDFRPGISMRKN
jgi:hypothetical protein